MIGSVIADSKVRAGLAPLDGRVDPGRVAFWGCGVRSEDPLSVWAQTRSRFFGVRGPLSRDVLALPGNTVLGDPGLLLPLLRPQATEMHGRTLCITHFHEKASSDEIKERTGVDDVVSAAIPGNQGAALALIDKISAASFVLSGALHGAITACAYGIPFAYFDSGYIDVPIKWRDFAASVGIPCVFATNLAQGRSLYRDAIQPNFRALPLTPLLEGAPFSVRPEILLKARHHDGCSDKRLTLTKVY